MELSQQKCKISATPLKEKSCSLDLMVLCHAITSWEQGPLEQAEKGHIVPLAVLFYGTFIYQL